MSTAAAPAPAHPDGPSFDRIASEAIDIAHRVVWSTVTTVDRAGRPRTRVLHPLWRLEPDGVRGWITTRRTPVKSAHLRANPQVSCAYLAPDHDVAFFDGVASWVVDPVGRREAWEAFRAVPPPVGYDPVAIFPGGPDSPDFAVLAVRPHRIQTLRGAALARGERPWLWAAPT